MTNKILPGHRYHRVPRPLMSDAYTINGFTLESKEALDNSTYYGTFRKMPTKHEPIYAKDDKRIVFAGLQAICDVLFYEPITHSEIDETLAFLKGRKATTAGFADFEFPEAVWRRVVDECGGYLPLKVVGIPEGAVVYPGEPFIRVTATKEGFGTLVPWFESTLLGVWAASERLTAARHAMEKYYTLIRSVEDAAVSDEQCKLWARLMIHDFGDRAAMCGQESDVVAKVHNYVFFGTDTFRAAFQNWKNGAPAAYGSSVKALAHRIVQGFEKEFDCYEQMYRSASDGELLSMVGDCYDYWSALENKLIPLALESKTSGNNKIIVARPDSGDSVKMVIGTLTRAKEAGLMEKVPCNLNGVYHGATTLRFIIGNGETYESVDKIMQACISNGFLPWRCGMFGVGGHLRNNLNRDHMSTKFALCAVGDENRPVIKLSEERGKGTLPDVKVLRNELALKSGITMALENEPLGKDSLVVYYDGEAETPFGEGYLDDFLTCEARVINGFSTMPLIGGHTTYEVERVVTDLTKKYRHTSKDRV